jgi:NAD-dependent SIR2 family protein deacetylase
MDINTFVDTPELFYSFAKRIWPNDGIVPSLTHRFFKLLATKRKLLRVFTQNIDGLEEAAGVPKAKVTYCHGHLRTARCLSCGKCARADELAPAVLRGEVPHCARCSRGVMKPDMVFFGERISTDVGGRMTKVSRA